VVLLALSASAPVAMALVHLLVHRTAGARCHPGSRLKLLARIELGVTLVWVILAGIAFSHLPLGLRLLNMSYVLVVSLGLGYCYFIVFALSETALRIRLLLKSYVAERQPGDGPAATPAEEYDPAAMIGERIDRLLAMGAAREEAGKIFGSKGLVYYFALSIHCLSQVWRAAIFGAGSDGRSFVIWNEK
jgi:hypothetical protein